MHCRWLGSPQAADELCRRTEWRWPRAESLTGTHSSVACHPHPAPLQHTDTRAKESHSQVPHQPAVSSVSSPVVEQGRTEYNWWVSLAHVSALSSFYCLDGVGWVTSWMQKNYVNKSVFSLLWQLLVTYWIRNISVTDNSKTVWQKVNVLLTQTSNICHKNNNEMKWKWTDLSKLQWSALPAHEFAPLETIHVRVKDASK